MGFPGGGYGCVPAVVRIRPFAAVTTASRRRENVRNDGSADGLRAFAAVTTASRRRENVRSGGVLAAEESRVPNGVYLLRAKCKRLAHVTLFFISHAGETAVSALQVQTVGTEQRVL